MKELDAKNIYANRTLRAGRNSTMNSTASSPAPLRAAAPRSRKNSESGTGATPRERAKQFEQQRKEQDRNNHEVCIKFLISDGCFLALNCSVHSKIILHVWNYL